jgi:hypothetical protein
MALAATERRKVPCPQCGLPMSRRSQLCVNCAAGARTALRDSRDASATRTCAKCGRTQPTEAFPKKGKTHHGSDRYSYCRPCTSEYQRVNKLRTIFNLTEEDYEAMLAYQNGKCAICVRPPGKNRLAVDHEHATGLIRGLVCWSCNRGLGYWADSIDRLAYAAAYIHHPPAVRALGEQRYGRKGRTTNKAPRKRKKKAA